ncbi:CHAP domain-containing protein [Clostridium beijerinckii]|uniref:N-acetylmuramoyl-L-alanine amidase n=1 Tax=Clostridium beijerinckii TaxID=1520 RepID=A0A1S8S8L1_CLOBE|nr:CHAP domain-containing protein [Clostridium beijerinckii]NRY59671.1 surface antigen [Clostridium beijerinckii]OOM61841.1 bacteriocin BCN5 [Clostridium beijerinckii]
MKKQLRKVMILAVSLLMLLGQTPNIVFAATSPNISSSAYNSENIFTQSGYKGQCTWFVWGRAYEKLGIKLNSQFYGNAKQWWNETTYPKGQTPAANSIAVFGNGSAGHVVFVESVSGDIIYFNEANYHLSKSYDGAEENQTVSAFKSRSANFLGFIYLQGNPSEPSDPTQSGFTYPNNAQVSGDFLYVRDSSGSIIPGRRVDDGDKITVLDVSYSTQLALVEYPTPSGVRTGYVTNATNIIKYFNAGAWKNGSTSETVYDSNGNVIGSLSPGETATPLYRKNGKLSVVYNTSKGANTKSGFVVYNGGFNKY